MAKGGKRTFGSKPKGKAKHKGARGNASKRKVTASKIKTKAKTANRGVKRRQQRVAKEKATAPVESPTMDNNRELDEAAPASVSDEIEEPPTRFPAAA
jgi:hypothetical protein